MTERELDELLRRVLLDAAKLEESREIGEEPTFRPTPRYQRQTRAMWADPKKWAAARKRPRWKAALRGVAMFLAVVTISFGSILAASPTARATVVRWVTEWYESHVTFRYNGPQHEEAMPRYAITALPEGFTESTEERLDWPSYVSITYRTEADPDLVVSIHQNSYHQESVSGGQVFYYKTSERGKRLAEILQRRFDYVLGEKNTRLAKPNGSYYLLLHVKQPIVIVECGFLSNWKEAANLNSGEYQDRLAWTIHVGIMEFLNQKKSS